MKIVDHELPDKFALLMHAALLKAFPVEDTRIDFQFPNSGALSRCEVYREIPIPSWSLYNREEDHIVRKIKAEIYFDNKPGRYAIQLFYLDPDFEKQFNLEAFQNEMNFYAPMILYRKKLPSVRASELQKR